MTLSPKYVASFALAFMFIIGWNVFLVKRDAELYKAYDKCQQFGNCTK